MEKQFGWALKLGKVESLRISKLGQTVLIRLMASWMWHWSAGSVWEGPEKGQ